MAVPFGFDAETHSPVPLQSAGPDAYTRDPRTRCLMLAYRPNGAAATPALWLEGDPVPFALVGHIANGGLLTGWNVNFFDRLVYDRILVPRHGFPPVLPDAWKDSMHLAAAANLPRSLDGCARAVGVEHETALKDSNRIRRVTDANRTAIPATVAEVLGSPDRFDPKLVDDLRWLAARCVQDVVLEEAVLARLPPWPEMRPWLHMPAIDRRINDRGVMVDLPLVRGLAKAAAIEKSRLNGEIAALTGGAVPRASNIESLKEWLVGRGVSVPRTDGDTEELPAGEDDDEDEKSRGSRWRLRKSDIADLMAREDVPVECRRALGIRLEAGKASTQKLNAMLVSADDEARLKGALILGGAQQTMRWSGSRWQAHNLVRDVFANPDEVAEANGLNAKADKTEVHRLCAISLRTAVEVGRTGDAELMRTMYQTIRRDAQGRSYLSGVVNWISRMLRRTLCAPAGSMLLNGDFAQVEARITMWLAQQTSMLSAFAGGEDVYRLTAAGIFRVALEAVSKEMRQTGKVSILALGFGGGINALIAMGLNYGLLMNAAEAMPIVSGFRESNSALMAFLAALDDCAALAVLNPGREYAVPPLGVVSYFVRDDCLCCRLPSGRLLRYWQPRLAQGYWPDGRPKQRLDLTGIAIKGKAVFRRSLFHTILCENAVQAIAADMLACALENMDDAGIPVVLHVHDSIAAEVAEDRADGLIPAFRQCMTGMPAWTAGLPIATDIDVSARFG